MPLTTISTGLSYWFPQHSHWLIKILYYSAGNQRRLKNGVWLDHSVAGNAFVPRERPAPFGPARPHRLPPLPTFPQTSARREQQRAELFVRWFPDWDPNVLPQEFFPRQWVQEPVALRRLAPDEPPRYRN